jgi:hypothetical protein
MIVGQSSGHISRETGRVRGSHYRYFLTISQQKPGKRYFGEKSFFKNSATYLPAIRIGILLF